MTECLHLASNSTSSLQRSVIIPQALNGSTSSKQTFSAKTFYMEGLANFISRETHKKTAANFASATSSDNKSASSSSDKKKKKRDKDDTKKNMTRG